MPRTLRITSNVEVRCNYLSESLLAPPIVVTDSCARILQVICTSLIGGLNHVGRGHSVLFIIRGAIGSGKTSAALVAGQVACLFAAGHRLPDAVADMYAFQQVSLHQAKEDLHLPKPPTFDNVPEPPTGSNIMVPVLVWITASSHHDWAATNDTNFARRFLEHCVKFFGGTLPSSEDPSEYYFAIAASLRSLGGGRKVALVIVVDEINAWLVDSRCSPLFHMFRALNGLFAKRRYAKAQSFFSFPILQTHLT
jgi:hypothetical protein